MKNKKTEMEDFNSNIISLYELASSERVTDFHELAFKVMEKILPFETGFTVSGIGKYDNLKVTSLYLHDLPHEKMRERVQIKDPDPMLNQGLASPFQTIRGDIWGMSNLSDAMLAHAKRYDQRYGLTMCRPAINSRWKDEVISLFRRNGQNEFSEYEKFLADLCFPHFFKAKSINLQLRTGEKDRVGDQFVLLATVSGELVTIDPETISVMQSEWRQWQPPFLPEVMLSHFNTANSKDFVGRKIKATAKLINGLFFIKIKENNIHSRLTKKEEEIAISVVNGMSYKEIADQFEISTATVRNHLHSIYTKLETTNKMSIHSILQSLKILD